MVILIALLVLGGILGAALGLVVRADGYGWRPPPAVRPEQERASTWPR